MSEQASSRIKLVLPPDGKQTRIDFYHSSSGRRNTQDWWHSLSTLFRNEHRGSRQDLEKFDRMMEKNGYSNRSRKNYLFILRRFFEYYEELDPAEITMGEIEEYNFEFFVSGRYSRSYQKQFMNALRLYFRYVRGVSINLRKLRKTGVGRRST